jgi:hypothetical protein
MVKNMNKNWFCKRTPTTLPHRAYFAGGRTVSNYRCREGLLATSLESVDLWWTSLKITMKEGGRD